MNRTEEAAGATGDAIKPAPPSQGAEVKGDAPAKKTPKKKKFSFKKPFKLSGLSFKRNQKEGGDNSSASSSTDEEQVQGEISACSEEGTAQEGKAVVPPESQEPQAKGVEASAASKGGDTEEAGRQAAEPSTPSVQESALHLPASRMSSWVRASEGSVSSKNCAALVRSLPGPGVLAAFCAQKGRGYCPLPATCTLLFSSVDSPIIHQAFLLRPVKDGPLQFSKLG